MNRLFFKNHVLSYRFILFIFSFTFFFALPSFINTAFVDPTQSGKFIAFSYLTLFFILIGLSKLILSQTICFRITVPEIILLSYFVFLVFNRYVIQTTPGFSARLYELAGLSILYILLREAPLRSYFWLLLALVCGALLQCSHGIAQLMGIVKSNNLSFNITGGFFNPGPYAGYIASILPITIGWLVFEKDMLKNAGEQFAFITQKASQSLRHFFFFGTCLCVFIVFATNSRAAVVSIIAGVSYLIVQKYKKSIGTRRKIIIGVSASVLLLVFFVVLYYLKKDSANGRFLIWKICAGVFSREPIIGHGYDRFNSVYMNAQAEYFKSHMQQDERLLADDIKYPYNEIIRVAIESGLVGLLFCAAVLISIFRVNTHQDPLGQICKAGIIGIIVFSFFSYPWDILPIKLTFLVFFSYLMSRPESFKPYSYTLKMDLYLKGILCLLMVFLVSVSYRGMKRIDEALRAWKAASAYYTNEQYPQSILLYRIAVTNLPNEGQLLTEYGKALYMNGAYQPALEKLLLARQYCSGTVLQLSIGDCNRNLKLYREAENAYKIASLMTPGKLFPMYSLVMLYRETNQVKNARVLAAKILKQDIKVYSIATHQIITEMKAVMNEPDKK